MAYDTEVLADSPFLYWRLGETAGTNSPDLGSGSHNGTYMGTYVLDDEYLVEGSAPLRAPLFNTTAVDGAVESGVITGIPSTAFTIEAWVRESPPQTTQTIFAYGNASFGSAIRLQNESDQVRAYVNGSNVLSGVINTRTWDQGVHLAFRWDNTAGDYEFFVNGTKRGSGTIAAAGVIADSGLVVVGQAWAGASPVTGTYAAGEELDGWIQEVALYPTSLSDARIRVHYLEGKRAHLINGPDTPVMDHPNQLLVLGQAASTLFYQRIYDLDRDGIGIGGYVYYTKDAVDPAPLSAETAPNHSGNLSALTHEIIEERPA